ncbi:neogenin isoform X5 [Brachionus plicatilis]|uniref:Neogenin isoform X5 n=1 Tax=Brachionus plicatilis TaxID=10195 RepID=A0A3M7S221_BRAPC|nr:neogenin isoform X5 [Brachionus plicatilis]
MNIEKNSNLSVYKDGSLEIVGVDESDSGWYHCVVKFRSVTFESRRAYVEVKKVVKNGPASASRMHPKFKLWPEDRVVQEEDEVSFECLAQNDAATGLTSSSFAYNWLKDGLALEPKFNDHVRIVHGVSLRIEKVLESDAGSYTCRICGHHALDHECDERSALLKVLVAPRFVKEPANLNASLKSDAELECSAYGVPHPTIQWYKNGEPIYPSDYFQFNSNQGNLKILGIIGQDEGYYQCVASNHLATIQSMAQLIVHSDHYNYDYDSNSLKTTHPVFLAPKTSAIIATSTTSAIVHLSSPLGLKTSLTEAKSIRIEWKAPSVMRGIDHLTYEVNWRAKGTQRQRQTNTTATACLIDGLTPNTEYMISVRAFGMGTYGPSAQIETTTHHHLSNAPVDFKAELIDYYASDGIVTFSPTLRFKWKRPNSNSLLKYRLYYQHVHYGPVTSGDLHANQFVPSQMEQYDDSLDEALSDDFYYEARGDQEEKSAEKYINIDIPSDFANSDHYEFLLEDLLKYSTYKFRLVAIDMNYFDRHGSSTWPNGFVASESEPFDEYIDESYLRENSVAILVETPSDVPDGPPENLATETVNTSAVLVKWQLPALDKRNGPIIGYTIDVKENDKQMWHLEVESEPRSKVVSGFLPGHKYSFRVTAKTGNGSGPASDWVIAQTFAHQMDESRVPGRPAQIHTEPTDQSIVIQWVAPPDSNFTLVRKYLLTYGIGYPKIEVEVPGDKNSFILENLVASSQYVVSLRAGNNAGYGMEVLKDVFTKRKSTLSHSENLFPPLNVQAVAISSRAIEVRWTDWHLRPDESIVDDRVYTVRYRIVADLAKAKFMYKNATERNVIINDLMANTLYDFAVRLVANGRESPWSMTTSQMTMEASPAPTQINIQSDPTSSGNVIITWKAPNLLHNSVIFK